MLVPFSGPKRRPDGIDVFLTNLGYSCEMVDLINGSNLLDESIFQKLLERAKAGEFVAIIAAPPCSTVSIARHYTSNTSEDGGPPAVRVRKQPLGRADVPENHRRELEQANAIFSRTCTILLAAYDAGTQFIIENPADHGDESIAHLFVDDQHAPLWILPMFIELRKRTGSEMVTFPMCSFGADYQKYTTLMYT